MRVMSISENINCDFGAYLALKQIAEINHDSFLDQADVIVGPAFARAYPPTREGEPLSGYWDSRDRDGLGYHLSPRYSPIGIEILWHNHRCWIKADRTEINIGLLTDVLRRVCHDYLPVALTWTFGNGDFAPGSLGATTTLIDEVETEAHCSWQHLYNWQPRLSKAKCADRPEIVIDTDEFVQTIRAHALGIDQKAAFNERENAAVVYFPGLNDHKNAVSRCTSVLRDVLQGGAEIAISSHSWLKSAAGRDRVGNGIEIAAKSVLMPEVLERLSAKLADQVDIPGMQLQYNYDLHAFAREWNGARWSAPTPIHRRDRGRALI